MGNIKENRIVKGGDENSKHELAESLRKYRLEHRLSQEDLAKLIGTSVFSINRWERQKHYPPQSTLKLMKMIGVL